MSKKTTREDKHIERIQDWVLNTMDYEDKNPNHTQFSAYEVACLIMQYNRDRLSGKIRTCG